MTQNLRYLEFGVLVGVNSMSRSSHVCVEGWTAKDPVTTVVQFVPSMETSRRKSLVPLKQQNTCTTFLDNVHYIGLRLTGPYWHRKKSGHNRCRASTVVLLLEAICVLKRNSGPKKSCHYKRGIFTEVNGHIKRRPEYSYLSLITRLDAFFT